MPYRDDSEAAFVRAEALTRGGPSEQVRRDRRNKRRSLLALVLFASTIGIASKVITTPWLRRELRGAPGSSCAAHEDDHAKARPIDKPERVRPATAAGAALVPMPETPLPFSLDTVIKVVEHDAVLVFGDDIETRAVRALRIDATGAAIDPAIDLTDVADIVSCSGSRWLLKLTAERDQPKYTIGVAGAPVVWSRSLPTGVKARTSWSVGCRMECW